MSRDPRITLSLAALNPSASDRLLVINSQDAQIAPQLRDIGHQQFLKPIHDALCAAGANVIDTPQGDYKLCIVNITKSKDESIGLIALGYSQLRDGGCLIINGAKTLGIESHYKAMRAYDGVSTPISKAHGKVFWVEKSKANADLGDGIAALGFHKNRDGFITTFGCFSPLHIDTGSAQLAGALPHNLRGTVADFGGGWGYLSHVVAQTNPDVTRIEMFESYAPALDCAAKNLCGLPVQLHWVDVTQLNGHSFDTIVMNPPFHHGRYSDLSLGQNFISAAARNLHKNGKIYMVANRQLAYEATLKRCFQFVEVLAQANGYKTLHARGVK